TANGYISDACIGSMQAALTAKSLLETSPDQLAKCISSMAHFMFLCRVHFTKGLIITLRLENRVIAKTMFPAFRPDNFTVDPTFEILNMPVRPGKRQRTDKGRPAIRMTADAVLNLFH